MKYIKKSAEPEILSNFKINFKKDFGLDAVYEELPTEIKNKLKIELSKEQYFICCYCMGRINQNNSHFEHIKPQKDFSDNTLDYDNLLISCNSMANNSENCGHKKGDWYDENAFITPLNPDCENIFTYSVNGEMDAVNKNGKTTIKKLNLNSLLLIRARKAAVLLSGLFDDDFSARKQEIADSYAIPNSNNELPQFCIAVMYCVNNYG